jgi:intracellular septation protein
VLSIRRGHASGLGGSSENGQAARQISHNRRDIFSAHVMKFLFDLFPVILFFLCLQDLRPLCCDRRGDGSPPLHRSAGCWFKGRKIDTMLWVSLVVITVFGGMTLILHDESFIKWKPTILYWVFAAVLLGGMLFLKKNLIRSLLAEQMELPEVAWTKLNWAWAGFFLFMGVINLWVAFNFSTDDWVNFKLFGATGLMLVFVLAQGFLLSKYMEEKK